MTITMRPGVAPIAGFGTLQARRALFGERLWLGSQYGQYSLAQPPVVPLLGVAPFTTFDRPLTIDALGWALSQNGAPGSLFRGGIWGTADDDTLEPGALLADTGAQPADAGAGFKTVALATPLTLQAGALYWLGGVCENGGANLRTLCVAANVTALTDAGTQRAENPGILLGFDPTGLTTLLGPGIRAGFTRAGFTPTTGLPDPFGATAYYKSEPVANAGARIPTLFVRAA